MTEELVVDGDLGPLKWNSELEWWEGEIRLASEQPFVLYVFSRKDAQRAITNQAREAIARIRGIEEACRRFASRELLAIHNSEWNDEIPISAEQFMGRLAPDAVEVHEGGYAEVHFKDGDLFWGHSVGVRVRPDGSIQEAVVEG